MRAFVSDSQAGDESHQLITNHLYAFNRQ